MLSMILVFCNHANNPVIYGVLNKQYRKAFKGFLRNFIVGRCSLKTSTDSSSHSIALGDSVDLRKGKVSHKRHVLSDQGNLLNDSSKVTAT